MIKRHLFTAKGPRTSNQDYGAIADLGDCGLLACIADGVGGNNSGEVASKMAVESVISSFNGDLISLDECVKRAHEAIKLEAQHNPILSGMATTLLCASISETRILGSHAGDSRAYLLRSSGIKQLTEDQTEAFRLYKSGELEKEVFATHPFRNRLYSAVGANKELVVQSYFHELTGGDRILLLTDGVYSVAGKKAIRDLSVSAQVFESFVENLTEFIEDNRPTDNYSFIALEIS